MTIAEAWKGLECVDLSVSLSPRYPVSWPTMPPFQKQLVNWFEDIDLPSGEHLPSGGHYYNQAFQMDEHTGTHVDLPAHVFPPEEMRRYAINPETPPEHFVGPAVMLDVREFLDQAAPGRSPRVPAGAVCAWEEKHGKIQPGEIVLLNTGYTDRYFQPLPEGNRLVREVLLSGAHPGWPVPDEEAFEHLGERGVRHVGISSPSMGALDDARGTHEAGVRRGMTYTENLIHLDRLPPRGAFYIGLPLKIAEQSGGPARAVAFIPARSGG